MKKLLFLGAMTAMMLGTASCSNDMEPEMTGDGNVQFTIELPGNIDSRAISDGLIATKLQVAVYKEDGTLLQDISLLGDKAVTMSGKKATVNFKLVKGLKYSFAFWAQNPNEDAYTFDAASGKVTVDYSKAVANADDGDAFSNREMNLEITGPITKTITLTRPFAQLNYGDVVADYNAAVAAGIDFKQTAVTVKQVANEYDILNQTTTGEVADITWDAANSAMEDNLVVNEETYKWLSMCYFLVPNDESTVTTELSMLNTAGSEFNKITVDNVPVKKNHRTNILGSLFTDDVNFNIIIDERFDQPDNNIFYPYLTDAAAIAEAIKTPGAVVNVAPGMDLVLDLRTVAEGVTINGNKSKLILSQTTNKVNSNNVTINGFTVDNTESGYSSISVTGCGFSMKDCEFTPSEAHTFGVYLSNMSEAGVYNFDGIVYDATADRRLIVPECKGTVNISNSILKSVVYPISTVNIVSDCEINVTNTQLIGWTSFNGGSNHVYNFENCYFGKLNYGYFRPYGGNGTNVINVNNCTFSDDYEGINPALNATIMITNSKRENGAALTEDIVDPDSANGKVYLDGTLIFDSNN